MKARVTEAHVAKLVSGLARRDLAIVATLDQVRAASGGQLRRLHFPGGTPLASARQAQRRLRYLCEARVLARLDHRVGGVGGGSMHAVYALDVAGQRLASACGPAGGLRLRRPWTPGVAFLSHALAVTELFVRLTEAAREGGELISFDAEPACWRAFTSLGGGRSWLKPDAFVRFGRGDLEHFSFVEVDRNTQSLPAIARKLATYRRYFQTGREQARWELFPKVVLLAPTEQRGAALATVVAAQPSGSRELFEVALYDEAVAALTGGGR